MPLSYLKEPRIEIPRLLELAHTEPRPCLLGIPRICAVPGHVNETWCVACHGNAVEFGKGRGIKAHDFFSVWGCARCHRWLDESYVAEWDEKLFAFREALDRQIIMWTMLLAQPTIRPKDAEPITLALDNLIDRGYAAPSPPYYALPTYAWKQETP